jgi:hypothetical protein
MLFEDEGSVFTTKEMLKKSCPSIKEVLKYDTLLSALIQQSAYVFLSAKSLCSGIYGHKIR